MDNLTNARQISVFAMNNSSVVACAVKNDHTTVCWDQNLYGELGNGGSGWSAHCGNASSTTTAETACAVPIFYDNSAQGNINRVAVGYYFPLWLDNKGKVYSAGKCENGVLRTGCTDNQTTAVTVMTGVKDIKVHPRNQIACALKIDNTLHCWGENNSNEITSAHANDIETPLEIATNVAHFGVFGASHSTPKCTIGFAYDNGTISCTTGWFSLRGTTFTCQNKYAGITKFADSTPANNVSYIAGGSFDSGMSHILGILDNGSVVGVGSNNYYQMVPTNRMSSTICAWQGTVAAITQDAQKCDRWAILPIGPSGW